jgi:hypothetical protein
MTIKVTCQRALAAVFRPFIKVHPQEAATAALMTLAAFLLLTAYYLICRKERTRGRWWCR